MSDFIFDKKESYTPEEVEKLLTEKDAHTKKRVASEKDIEFSKKLETEKLNWDKGIKDKKINDDFLNEVPSQNRKVVETLLSKGETQESIKKEFSNLFEKTKTNIDLDEIINGKFKEIQIESSKETDEEFMKKANSGKLDLKDEKVITRYQEIKKKKIA